MARKKSKNIVTLDQKRLVFISFFIFFIFCSLVFKFYKIQIIEGDKWQRIAHNQHEHIVTEYFVRGCFYSNNSIKPSHPSVDQALVLEVPKFHLYVDPDSIPLKYKTLISNKLFEFINVKNKEKIVAELHKQSRSRKLFMWLDRIVKDNINKWWFSFAKENKIASNALFFIQDYKRSYPFGSMLSQVMHTVQDEKDAFTFQALPTGGLELYYNNILKGKLGKRKILRSPRHPLDMGVILDKPDNGADVYLTINHYLQSIAEDELTKGINKVNAKGAWAIMMDPNTGEILALAQRPEFDLTKYSKYYNDSSMQEHTKIKAVVDAYEPGSIMKPITIAIAMKANEEMQKLNLPLIFSPDEKIATDNGYLPGRTRPLKDGRRHNFLNMNLAIQKSSNIYVARIVERIINTLGEEWYRKALCDIFGFGKKTNIELPGENPGLVPSIGKLHANGTLEWSKSTPYSLAIGYNILANPIQMIRVFSILVNGGYDIQPTLVRKILKKNKDQQTLLLDNTKKNLSKRKQILSTKNSEYLKKAMKFTTKLGGTSRVGDIMGYTEGGKSGTAEKIIDGKYNKNTNISSFIGFVPADNPRFVLMIVVDEPEKKFVPGLGKLQHGGVCAGPIFKEIATRSLQYLEVAPDDPYGYPYGDPRRNVDLADYSIELQELKELYKRWND